MGVTIHWLDGRRSSASSVGVVSAVRLSDSTALSPAEEPLTLAEAKAHLRITHELEDGVIWTRLHAARERVERDTGVACLPQRWQITIEEFPWWRHALTLPIWPILSVDVFGYYRTDGTFVSLLAGSPAPAPFLLQGGRPARLALGEDDTWPTTLRRTDPGILEVTAGYPTADAVPEDLKQAIRVLLDHPDLLDAGARERYEWWIRTWVLPSA